MSKRIQIITDSAADMTIEELQAHDVALVPMPLIVGDNSFFDDHTLPMSALWEAMAQGSVVKTSQPSPDSFLQAFLSAKAEGRSVVCVCLSSQLSGTYQSAVIAKGLADYAGIHLVDSRGAGIAEKLVVLEACRLRDEGLSAAEIAERLNTFRARVRLYACIDTLEYLVKGGRLSAAAGHIGTLLNLKPIFCFSSEGKVDIIRKERGVRRAVSAIDELLRDHMPDTHYPVLAVYAKSADNCDALLEYCRGSGSLAAVDSEQEIGATIGCFIGPGGFCIAYVEKE